MDDLDDIEQLRIAALQTLHQKKVEPRPHIIPQTNYLDHNNGRVAVPGGGGFMDDGPISAFPGYTNSRIQLSPRSVSYMAIVILLIHIYPMTI